MNARSKVLLVVALLATASHRLVLGLAPALPRPTGGTGSRMVDGNSKHLSDTAIGQHTSRSLVNIQISPANLSEDLDQIRACRLSAFGHQRNENGEIQLLRSQERFVNAESAMEGRSICLVAKEAEPPCRILGTADLVPKDDGSVLLNNVFVLPKARGKGVAGKLVKEAEEIAKQRATKITLSVDTTNTPAVSLYQKLAYETQGVHSLLYRIAKLTNFNLRVVMSKDLSAQSQVVTR